MADPGPSTLDDILGLRLRMANGAVQRHFAEHFAELALTQKQVSVLWLAGDMPGIAQTDLARRLQIDRATTMTIVHLLERRGLLARRPAEGDARRIALQLTSEGQATLVSAKVAIAEHEQWLRARFSAREVETLVLLLTRICD